MKKLTPTLLWCLWSSNCHTGPNVVLQPIKGKGARNNEVRKTQKTERSLCPAVLSHFDQQYSEELGDLWTSARAVFLDPQSWQYGVMLNRFSVVTDIMQILQSQGFSALLPQTQGSPEDSDFQPYITSHALTQGSQSKPCLTLPHTSLQCYIHSSPLRFPSQAHRPGQLKQYYLLNAASLLPVLALQIRDGDKVLDLCSAPGGKAIAIMQSATPELLCCNEPDPHRRDWLSKTLASFLPSSLNNRVVVSAQDGQAFGQSEAGFYDKVLVDAPCSNDRSWLYSSNSQQVAQRLKDRVRLPVLQAQLLRSALSAVRPGGVVVYSTCTLSSFENYAVVETVLKDFPEAEPEDLWEEIAISLKKYFEFSSYPGHSQLRPDPSLLPESSAASAYHHRLGILVVPQPGKTWGPMFLSRIRRKE
ncbi:tRNA (cytosine(34)-C(5))-methyltransferase, mitochondrial isoform X2 [Melanotaenia boesemani]|uniref:tRNA (cytosine(34)-C(5))-methyltransferase, mitochondrial isoform X2 n=1 Tax=Melanotaenia boesemani TaxID=1250792 RepID=UPI001C04BEA1|nr:tRNA (cytosine(34)-C(5))-methyltransferase, mitochondrial isoform X2 [Melanotaenia boesemani]